MANELFVSLRLNSPPGKPIYCNLESSYQTKNVGEITREVLERTAQSESEHTATARQLLQSIDRNPANWKASTVYKAKDPVTGEMVKIQMSDLVRKFIEAKKIGSNETNNLELYLYIHLGGGCTTGGTYVNPLSPY